VEFAGGHDKAISLMQKMFDYCGRPLSSDFERDEIGFYLYPDRNRDFTY
jgi:hypothetical protein